MQKYILSCCSTADLAEERFKAKDILCICFYYMLDGIAYSDDLGKSMPFDRFYGAITDGAETQTSQVNVDEFITYFTPFLEAGQDIFHTAVIPAPDRARLVLPTSRNKSYEE